MPDCTNKQTEKIITMLMQIDGTFIFVVISFLIFLFIIKTILFNPITKILDEREKFYAKNTKMETESKEKTSALINEKEKALKESRLEASQIIKETSKKANDENIKIIKETKKEIQEKIEKNKEELETAKENSKKELKNEISSFVSSIVSKVLNDNITVQIEEERINKHLNIG